MGVMRTHYASPERATPKALDSEIEFVTESPMVSGLLQAVSGLLAVVNEHRQIVALNDTFLKLLGIDNPTEALGLRPGEALQCIHADEEPAGCGTTRFCSTCGAAIAMVSSFERNAPTECVCALTTKRGPTTLDMSLLIRAHPVLIREQRFLILFAQDITRQQHRAALERTFFHDITNMISGLLLCCQMLREDHPSELADLVSMTASRLHQEVEIQRSLAEDGESSYRARWDEVPVARILSDLRLFFANHPAAENKTLLFADTESPRMIYTDISAASRVLTNMILNALEATPSGGEARIWTEREDSAVTFKVWNALAIPADVARRVFQRNFSTNPQAGRGIGTFSMKLFGEKVLGGQVGFSSSEQEGTVFWLRHPA